jgi:hypothetical protein
VIQVDSSRSGAEEEEMITRLLAVESVDEPTEIVIHVNMLKEGWDVTNLYTIVPLRAANARTLIEQSIGRGLRLPYGKRTGVAAVDRLNIVAHDKFQEIIDEANRGDSPIRLKQVILEPPSADDRKVSVQVGSGAMTHGWGCAASRRPCVTHPAPVRSSTAPASAAPAPVFTTEAKRHAARVVMDVIGQYEVKRDLVPTSSALLTPEVQSAILAEVSERLKPPRANCWRARTGRACAGPGHGGERRPPRSWSADHRHSRGLRWCPPARSRPAATRSSSWHAAQLPAGPARDRRAGAAHQPAVHDEPGGRHPGTALRGLHRQEADRLRRHRLLHPGRSAVRPGRAGGALPGAELLGSRAVTSWFDTYGA